MVGSIMAKNISNKSVFYLMHIPYSYMSILFNTKFIFCVSFKKLNVRGLLDCYKSGDLRGNSKEPLHQVHLQRNADAALSLFLKHVSYLEQKEER